MKKNMIIQKWCSLLILLLMGSLPAIAYDITVVQPSNGTITVKVGETTATTEITNVAENATVTIEITPEESYFLSEVTVHVRKYVTDGAQTRTPDYTSAVTVTTVKKGQYTFTMPSRNVEVSAEFTVVPAEARDMGENGSTAGKYYETLAEALDATTGVTAGNTVQLQIDVTASLTISRNITLDLNDKMLKATDGNRVIDLTAGTLTIVDNGTTARYWHKNDNNYWEDPKPSSDDDHPETYKTTGGCITGGNIAGDERGAGIKVSTGATLNFNGGNLVGNYAAAGAGGGLYVGDDNGNVTASITGNAVICGNAAKYGGGIRFYKGVLSLTGGTIQYNYCSTSDYDKGSGGGVSLFDGTLNLSGAVTIKNNTYNTVTSNLWIYTGKKATITGALTDSDIGVRMASVTGTFTSGYNTNNPSVDPTALFHCDMEDNTSTYPYKVLHELDDNNEAQIYVYGGTDDNIQWAYNTSSKTLTISKKQGVSDNVAMPNYMYNNNQTSSSNYTKQIPWLPFHSVIENLVVETGVTTIGAGCCSKLDKKFSNLSSVTLSEGLLKICTTAFRDCSSLTTINLPSTLTTIEDYAFLRAGLTSIVVRENITSIGKGAFSTNSATPPLTTFVLLRTDGTVSLGASAFSGNSNVSIYVPNSKVSSYKGATNWKTYSGKIKGWTYDMTNTNTTVTLAAAEADYTGENIKPTLSSVIINGDANIVSDDTNVNALNLTETFDNADVPVTAYTVEYAVDATTPAFSTTQPKAVNNYLVRVKGGVANQDYSGTSSTANFYIKRNMANEGIVLDGTRQWDTYYASEDLALPPGVSAYIVTAYSNTSVTASSIGYIPKNTGVLLYSASAVDAANLKASAYTGDQGNFTGNILKGGVTTMESGGANYILFNNAFVLADGTSLADKRCYIHLSAPAATRSLTIDGGDGTTGLSEELIVNSEEGDSDVWYDMSGRRLQGKPTRKGLYIRNGKKTVIK